MTSEAASTGKSVYIYPLPGGRKRMKLFHAHLMDIGATQKLPPDVAELAPYEPVKLDDTGMVADRIMQNMHISE